MLKIWLLKQVNCEEGKRDIFCRDGALMSSVGSEARDNRRQERRFDLFLLTGNASSQLV